MRGGLHFGAVNDTVPVNQIKRASPRILKAHTIFYVNKMLNIKETRKCHIEENLVYIQFKHIFIWNAKQPKPRLQQKVTGLTSTAGVEVLSC